MDETSAPFSVRRFLRQRKALLVHFSTPMSRHTYLFPEDLRNAMRLVDTPISFSTILANDVGPFSRPEMAPHEANAAGSVGIMVDVNDAGSVVTVGPSDDGTYFDKTTGSFVSGGNPVSQATCDASIGQRRTANEWFVKNYTVIGLFVFFPIWVRQKRIVSHCPDTVMAETEIPLELILSEFQRERVVTVHQGHLWEYDRTARSWRPTDYDSIVPP